jgi:glycosyltransferase involved in cell wall biosynthesis
MISVLTLTYKRHHILEEAIESFLRQKIDHPKEMVIINDNKDAEYIFNHPEVRIINLKKRFPSISEKLKWGFDQCKYNYMYRLDDDDLLSETALATACEDIIENPGYDVYRSSGFYFFVDNKFERISSNVNNGNIYTKDYISGIKWPNTSVGEDTEITFHQKAKIYEARNKKPTMIYRWGMNTFHLSGAGDRPSEIALQQADESLERIKSAASGTIHLHPRFNADYYEQINRDSK